MNARALLGGLLTSGAILGIGIGLGTAAQHATVVGAPSTSDPISGPADAGPGTGATNGGTATGGATGTGATPAVADGTYTGSSVPTRFGSVQVQVTVSGGRISDVTALHLTDSDGRSVQISNRAAPVLHDEVLSSQSANVRMVSGATYTSDAYLRSVQSALDQAGF